MTAAPASPQSTEPSPRRWFERLWRSTFVWIVVVLCSVNLVASSWFAAYDPLQWLDELELISLDRLGITKVTDILQSGQDPTVVILGSSLMLFPSFYLDEELGLRTGSTGSHGKKQMHRLLSYSHVRYLERLLSAQIGSPVSVTNAAVAGSLISDQYLIAKKYLAAGRRPKVCVLTVAPRDFLDNVRKEVDRTATSTTLAEFVSPPEFLGLLVSDPIQAMTKVGPLVGTTLNGVSICYKCRFDIQQLVTGIVGRLTGYPVSLLHVAKHRDQEAADRLPPPPTPTPRRTTAGGTSPVAPPTAERNTLPDLGAYSNMYLPINEELFNKQQTSLQMLLQLLQSNNVPTVVVDMPLTEQNLAILPKSTLSEYESRLQSTCKTYGARLWHPDLHLSLSDFSDSAHMNATGGKKFFTALNSYLSAMLTK